MLLNLLADAYRTVEIGEATLYALIGFLIVFVGITFLILVVWLVGKFMSPQQQAAKPVQKATVKTEIAASEAATTDEIDEETLAVITAALMAYYQSNNPKCEFTVKRIKRI